MFEILFYQPILNFLIFIYNVIPGNDLGISIIILTIFVKLALYPLTKKQLESQKALQELQPKIEEIKQKYKDKKEEMGIAMMNVYKDNKVNPLASCLPLLIQLPFLLAIFQVFQKGFENGSLNLLYSFINKPENINYISFGFLDLSQKNITLAVLAGVAQFIQAKMIQTKRPKPKVEGSSDEDMTAIMNKQIMYVMPVMTVVIGVSFNGGLIFYWFISTVITIIQQYFVFNKKYDIISKTITDNSAIEGEIISK